MTKSPLGVCVPTGSPARSHREKFSLNPRGDYLWLLIVRAYVAQDQVQRDPNIIIDVVSIV